jgi:hypothetical protein
MLGHPLVLYGSQQESSLVYGGAERLSLIRVDAEGHLEIVLAPGILVAMDLQQVASAATVTAGVAGLLAVGGPAADSAVAVGNPLLFGGVYLTNITAAPVANTEIGSILIDSYRRLRIVGSVLDGVAVDATEAPLKMGAVSSQVPATIANNLMVQLITDLERFLRVVSKAYDAVSASDRVACNTIADDRDEAAQVWAAETNTGVGTSYYPAAGGYEVGNRDHITLQLVMTDNTTTIQASNDAATWIDITNSVLDMGAGVYLTPSFATGAGLSANWMLDLQNINARYVRCAVVYPDAGNATSIKAMTRKA